MKKKIKKIGIITKRNNSHYKSLIKKIHTYLKKKKKTVLCDANSFEACGEEGGYKKEQLISKVDLAIVMGGDGTLLKTARRTSTNKTLILGVNLGNLGFLTECTPTKVFESLDAILDGDYFIDKRSLLRVTIYRRGKKIRTFLALNDAVVNQGSFARLIDLDLSISGRKVVGFKADGMIVSTPTGS
ncbi:NAD(+) kinase, partial [Candidatus Peregrinibacteria bacterium]|nr:NAD(+) kinase [Candidatus Peregrinibacteria bacterium]